MALLADCGNEVPGESLSGGGGRGEVLWACYSTLNLLLSKAGRGIVKGEVG